MKKNRIWESECYYDKAREGSGDMKHPGMRILLNIAKVSETVLDLGCGEGTRLNIVVSGRTRGCGIDISSTAIRRARKRYPKLKFIRHNLKNLPFKDASFDLVYSAFVLEHLTGVKECLDEAVRVTKHDAVFICPNYGAPNRASPNFKGSRIKKLFNGLSGSLKNQGIDSWNKVMPKRRLNQSNYNPDDDTTIEPYIGSLMNYLREKGMSIKHFTTCWENELKNAKIHQILFKYLAKMNIKPFAYWGPHIVVHAKKYQK